MRVGHELRG
jgi:hypothetical protein